MAAPKSRRAYWNCLLVLPAAGLMFPGVYAKADPALFGFPFFYWYQILWVVLTSVITGIVYLATRRHA